MKKETRYTNEGNPVVLLDYVTLPEGVYVRTLGGTTVLSLWQWNGLNATPSVPYGWELTEGGTLRHTETGVTLAGPGEVGFGSAFEDSINIVLADGTKLGLDQAINYLKAAQANASLVEA